MRSTNDNVVRGRSYEFLQYEIIIYHTKVTLHKNFQIYITLFLLYFNSQQLLLSRHHLRLKKDHRQHLLVSTAL